MKNLRFHESHCEHIMLVLYNKVKICTWLDLKQFVFYVVKFLYNDVFSKNHGKSLYLSTTVLKKIVLVKRKGLGT